jgi:hypothetical protein
MIDASVNERVTARRAAGNANEFVGRRGQAKME